MEAVMFSLSKDWNPHQKSLKGIIQKEEKHDEAIKKILYLHSLVHSSEVSGTKINTFEDEVFDGLVYDKILDKPTIECAKFPWHIWHITRIEDLTANILIADDKQVFLSDDWSNRINVDISDTGNGMTDEKIFELSKQFDIEQLREYRKAVGLRTRDIIKNMNPGDFRIKVSKERLDRILHEGGVLDIKDSISLLEFWDKKNIAGIVNMPILRHHVVHLNKLLALKKKYCK